MHRIDADAVATVFQRNAFGHAPHGELAAHIGGKASDARQTAGGGNVHYGAATSLLHGCQHRLHTQPAAGLVYAYHRLVILKTEVFQRSHAQDTGIVDEHIQTSKTLHSGSYRMLPALRRGNIQMQEQGLLTQFASQCPTRLLKHVGDDHLRSLGDKEAHQRRAQTTCSTGDQYDLSGKLLHAPLLLTVNINGVCNTCRKSPPTSYEGGHRGDVPSLSGPMVLFGDAAAALKP